MTETVLSIIIPANNEEDYIGACLHALATQQMTGLSPQSVQIILAANACKDATVKNAEAERAALEAAGFSFVVLDLPLPGKLNALNVAEGVAEGRVLAYLDADVRVERTMVQALIAALDTDVPRYASGHLVVAPAKSWTTRHFAKTWQMLPFMTTNVQGAGLFAVNRAGRVRWAEFPDIIADDGFVRLMFAPEERIKVDAVYHWPMVEGFGALVRVRRRQDAGVRELAQKFPDIMRNESKPIMTLGTHMRLFARAPLSYSVYVFVMLNVKFGRHGAGGWTRGR